MNEDHYVRTTKELYIWEEDERGTRRVARCPDCGKTSFQFFNGFCPSCYGMMVNKNE